jgi:primosomal protein N' (replication factor Y)
LKTFQHTEVIGPFPPPVTKINDIFRLNILIKTPDLTNIKLIIAKMDLAVSTEVIVDVEPLNML